jgi:hypothetical protein
LQLGVADVALTQPQRWALAATLVDVAIHQWDGHIERATRSAASEIEHPAKATMRPISMPRSLGNQLPGVLRDLLDGTEIAGREGLTFLLITSDETGWPHMALLSVGELVCVDGRTLRSGLWLHSSTSKNLSRDGRGLLAIVAEGNGYYVRLRARRGTDLDLGSEGRLAFFVLEVEDVLEDAADYATLTSGVTFRLNHPEQVVPRWQRTVSALLAASA